MTDMTFEAALYARTGQMFDSCTRCGKCVDICPITGPAGIDDNVPEGVITGVLDIVRTGDGPEASKAWATGCALTGCYSAWGPDADRRAKLLIYLAVEGLRSGAYLHRPPHWPNRKANGLSLSSL